jgi:methylase of polypeptide subunit release factors
MNIGTLESIPIDAYPLRLVTPERFAAISSVLQVRGFTEQYAKQSLREAGFPGITAEPFSPGQLTQPESLLLKVFVQLDPVSQKEFQETVGRSTIEAMVDADLLRLDAANPGQLHSSVFLCPVQGVIIASDRYNLASNAVRLVDGVYPAIRTSEFINLLPRNKVETLLDLCAGAGVCGLALANSAQKVTLCDITPRSAHYAEFNSHLNGFHNVEILQGDLYEPVGERTFERIVAHPPYLPSVKDVHIWRDGGPLGDSILRRIVEGLPNHLERGGDFTTFCLGTDTDKSRFEQTVRTWLGASEREYDIIFATRRNLSPKELAKEMSDQESGTESQEILTSLEEGFRLAGVHGFCLGALAIRRHNSVDQLPLTLRTVLGSKSDARSFQFAFHWNPLCSRSTLGVEFAHQKPYLCPHMTMTTTHAVRDGKLQPVESILRTEWPFLHMGKADRTVLDILPCFNGRRTVSEVYTRAKASRTIHHSVTLNGFTSTVCTLIARGFLSLPDPTYQQD